MTDKTDDLTHLERVARADLKEGRRLLDKYNAQMNGNNSMELGAWLDDHSDFLVESAEAVLDLIERVRAAEGKCAELECFERFCDEEMADPASDDLTVQLAVELTHVKAERDALRAENKQRDSDIGFLISVINTVRSATGEGPEEEDAAVFWQINHDHVRRAAALHTEGGE